MRRQDGYDRFSTPDQVALPILLSGFFSAAEKKVTFISFPKNELVMFYWLAHDFKQDFSNCGPTKHSKLISSCLCQNLITWIVTEKTENIFLFQKANERNFFHVFLCPLIEIWNQVLVITRSWTFSTSSKDFPFYCTFFLLLISSSISTVGTFCATCPITGYLCQVIELNCLVFSFLDVNFENFLKLFSIPGELIVAFC